MIPCVGCLSGLAGRDARGAIRPTIGIVARSRRNVNTYIPVSRHWRNWRICVCFPCTSCRACPRGSSYVPLVDCVRRTPTLVVFVRVRGQYRSLFGLPFSSFLKKFFFLTNSYKRKSGEEGKNHTGATRKGMDHSPNHNMPVTPYTARERNSTGIPQNANGAGLLPPHFQPQPLR